MTSRIPLLACLLLLGLSTAAASAAAPPEQNVTYAYARVLRATPVDAPIRERAPEEQGERRIVAYDVEYIYKGETFMSRLDHDPGSRLRIRIAITPDDDADDGR